MTRTDTARGRGPRRAARGDRGPRRHPGPPGRHRQRRAVADARRLGRDAAVPRGRRRPPGLDQPADGARPQADRDLVALRLLAASSGTARTARSCRDLAERWSVDADRRGLDVRPPRRTRAGTTASRSPPTTSCSRSGRSRTRRTRARAPTSWSEVDGPGRVADRDRHVHARRRRSAGSSRRRPSRSPRRTCSARSRSSLLADHPFGQQPVGSGPFALASLDADTAELVPAATALPPAEAAPTRRPPPTDSLDDGPPDAPAGACRSPYLAGHRVPLLRRRRRPRRGLPRGRRSTRRPGCRRPTRPTSPRPPAAGSCATRARR